MFYVIYDDLMTKITRYGKMMSISQMNGTDSPVSNNGRVKDVFVNWMLDSNYMIPFKNS